jgi:hypothetical protein
MAEVVGQGVIRLEGDSRPFRATLQQTKREADGWVANVGRGIAQGIGQAVFFTLAKGIGAAVGQIRQGIGAASDLNETITKTTVVFGAASQGVLDWSTTSATALGQSRQQALAAAADFGNLFTSMGVGRAAAADMSTELVELAADLASFNNIDPTEALDKLRSGLVGETEPLRTLGVFLNETVVAAKAMELGFGATSQELSEQEKLLARYQIILEQTANSQGDFARTIGSTANQERILRAQLEDARAQLGKSFEPVYNAILRGLNQVIQQVLPYGTRIMASLAQGMADGIRFFLPIVQLIRSFFAYWLRPSSPPRALPDLAAWGAQAMREYLKGWTEADFGTLQQIGGAIEQVLRSLVSAGRIQETDLISRVLGGQAAIARAVAEFKQAGVVSQGTLRLIEQAAGPAGRSVRGLAEEYFNLQRATQRVTAAQDELTAVTERYDSAITPLQQKLDAIRSRQQDLRDQQRLADLYGVVADASADASERQLANLEIQEIELARQIRTREEERDTAVGAAQAKVEAAQKEEAAAASRVHLQQAALDAQVKANGLIGEEIALRERLANEAMAEEARRLRELEQARQEAEREAEAQRQALERLYQAQLDYNLATADTPGKIALLRMELQRYNPQQEEYWRILGQIAGLEKQLAEQRSQGPLLPDLPPIEEIQLDPEVEQAFADLGKAVEEFFALWNEPSNAKLPEWLREVVDVFKGLPTQLDGLAEALRKLDEKLYLFLRTLNLIPPDIEGAVDDIVANVERMEARSTGGFGRTSQAIEQSMQDSGRAVSGFSDELGRQLDAQERKLASKQEPFRTGGRTLVESIFDGMQTAWTLSGIPWLLRALQSLVDLLPGSEPKNPDSPLFGLGAAGEAMVDNLWAGIRARWSALTQWWTAQLTWLRNQLPFSEPRDPASPLRGLVHAGEAISRQITEGMQRAPIRVTPVAAGALSAAVETNYYAIEQAFYGAQPDFGGVRAATASGLLDARRARGR